MTRILEGKPVATALIARARDRVDAGRRQGRSHPALASVHRGGATPFSVYLRQQARVAGEAGVMFTDAGLAADAGPRALAEKVGTLDADRAVHAVLVEHPLPAELDFAGALRHLRPEKDVDGVGTASLGLLVEQRPIHAPAVARGALALARHYGIELKGRRVAVVGRSATVGTPLALLMLAHGAGGDATVTVAHRGTTDLARSLRDTEVIFGCAGQPGLLNRRTVPQGASIIDVGLSTVADPARPNGVRIAGDADAPDLDGWADALSPVPGGVGPVTVAQLMLNAVDAWMLQTEPGAP
ncbi:MAG: bifunctional 5,10-methylenetetrahydrofolate dehydrogenase/5,10-methenyltetrahydrofolate cyclohydrolase [Thermoplasmata archaeon]|nr:bifunctional 5,10-methylenetetrahydrofolate dehydrogenase/5,10-methenyltetrahydrofolate cyclohydrolase [Thermoplasmata archaeon]